MIDLVSFLQARLDEREALLNRVGPARLAWATFREADGSMRYASAVSENADVWVCDGHRVEPASVQVVFDPAQELADVKAKRQMLDEHHDDGGHCDVCADPPQYDATWQPFPCRTVRLLALPYAGHLDYQEGWKL